MEPIQIQFESNTLNWVFDKKGKTIAVVCSNVIYIGTFVVKGSDAFFRLDDVKVLPIDAISDLEERYETAPSLGDYRSIEINLFQVQAVFDFP